MWVGLIQSAEGIVRKRLASLEEGILLADSLWTWTAIIPWASSQLAYPADFELADLHKHSLPRALFLCRTLMIHHDTSIPLGECEAMVSDSQNENLKILCLHLIIILKIRHSYSGSSGYSFPIRGPLYNISDEVHDRVMTVGARWLSKVTAL